MRAPTLLLATLLLLASPALAASGQAEPRGTPVVLVAGIFDTGEKMRPLDEALARRGFRHRTRLDLTPSDGSAPLGALAAQLASGVERICSESGAAQVDLVAFSMGGLVARCWLQERGGLPRLRRLVTIATPHHGTWAGYAFSQPGTREMRPGSELLTRLNRHAGVLSTRRCASFWTPLDAIILPPSSSVVPWAENRAFEVPAHALLLSDPSLQAAVAEVLEAP